MQAKKNLLLILLILLFSINAIAEVNTMDGSFRYGLDLFSQGRRLKISYNSRSLHEGIFGLGWCASFEKKVVFRKNSFWLLDCDLPSPIKLSASQAKKMKFFNPYKMEKTERGYRISNGKEKTEVHMKNSLLESVEGSKISYRFQYDRNMNLSIVIDQLNQKKELMLYDDEDRIKTHQYSQGCFDQVDYEKNGQDQFTTVVDRSCPQKAKEKILYVFSVKLNKKQERQISSIQIRRQIPTRISEIP